MIAESTVISATMDGVDQPENMEVAIECLSGIQHKMIVHPLL